MWQRDNNGIGKPLLVFSIGFTAENHDTGLFRFGSIEKNSAKN